MREKVEDGSSVAGVLKMLARIITKAIAAQFDSLRAMLSSEVERVVDKTSRAATESDMICLDELRGTGRSESS